MRVLLQHPEASDGRAGSFDEDLRLTGAPSTIITPVLSVGPIRERSERRATPHVKPAASSR